MRNSILERVRGGYRRSQVVMYSVVLPMMLLAFTLGGALESTKRILLVLLGFSTIVFVHELGHFLVARACSVRCEAFSIGIGPRLLGWRKNYGLTFGNDPVDKLKEDAKKKSQEGVAGTDVDTKNLTDDILGRTKKEVDLASLGECDYRISWLPLGGYVRMLGQDDMDATKVSSDPRAFNQRPVWQRMCIVSAGVIMNIIFAAIVFSIVFHPDLGVLFPPAQVGGVAVGSPAWADGKGMKVGDRVVSINGKKPLGFMEFTDVVIASALSDGSETVRFEVERTGKDGKVETLIFDFKPVLQERTGFLGIGIEPMQSLKLYVDKPFLSELAKVNKWSKERTDEIMKLDEGDEIVAVNREKITTFTELNAAVQGSRGEPIVITVHNTKKDVRIADRDVKIWPQLEEALGVKGLPSAFLGIGPRTKVVGIAPGDPAAKAGLQAGDVITLLGTRTDPSVEQLFEIVGGNPGKPLAVKVLRDGKELSFTVVPKDVKGRGLFGIVPGIANDDMTAIVRDGSGYEGLMAGKGATLTAVDGVPVKTWTEAINVVRSKPAGSTVEYAFGVEGKDVKVSRAVDGAFATKLATETTYRIGLPIENLMQLQKADSPLQAMWMGAEHTEKFVKQVYMTLRGMFLRTVSPTNLHGILVIGKVGHDVQDRGFIWLCYLMAMVSVNLAVANFLPLPVVDGGLFLLLILEKIRGKPLSLKVQGVIQTVGVVLLAALFLFVTFNDILFLIPK